MNRTHLGLLTLDLRFLPLRQTFLSWLETSRLLGGNYFGREIVWRGYVSISLIVPQKDENNNKNNKIVLAM